MTNMNGLRYSPKTRLLLISNIGESKVTYSVAQSYSIFSLYSNNDLMTIKF